MRVSFFFSCSSSSLSSPRSSLGEVGAGSGQHEKKGEGGYREQHQLPSLQWLVLHGALCRPGSGANEGDDGAAASEHTTATDPRIVKRDLRKGIVRADKDLRVTTDFRGSLLVWARGIVSASAARFASPSSLGPSPRQRGGARRTSGC